VVCGTYQVQMVWWGRRRIPSMVAELGVGCVPVEDREVQSCCLSLRGGASKGIGGDRVGVEVRGRVSQGEGQGPVRVAPPAAWCIACNGR